MITEFQLLNLLCCYLNENETAFPELRKNLPRQGLSALGCSLLELNFQSAEEAIAIYTNNLRGRIEHGMSSIKNTENPRWERFFSDLITDLDELESNQPLNDFHAELIKERRQQALNLLTETFDSSKFNISAKENELLTLQFDCRISKLKHKRSDILNPPEFLKKLWKKHEEGFNPFVAFPL